MEHKTNTFMIKKIAAITLAGMMTVGTLQAQSTSTSSYGSNILRLAPISVTDMGVGFGLSYEKILGKEQKVGIIFPFALLLEEGYYYDPMNNYNGKRYNSYFNFQPGVKIYPFGQRKVTYAVGPSLSFTYGGGSEWESSWDPGFSRQIDFTRFRIGMLVNNYVNFQITQSFNLGLEAGLGMAYYDMTRRNDGISTSTYNEGFNVIGQFAMTIGYRF